MKGWGCHLVDEGNPGTAGSTVQRKRGTCRGCVPRASALSASAGLLAAP